MKIEKLFEGTLSGGATKEVNAGRDHVNGFLILAKSIKNLVVTVKYRGERTIMQASKLKLSVVENIADNVLGSTNRIGQLISNMVDDTTTKVAIEGLFPNMLAQETATMKRAVFIPVGSVYLNGDAEIDVTVENTDIADADQSISILRISNSYEPEHHLVFDKMQSVNETYKNSLMLIATRSNATDNPEFQIDSPEGLNVIDFDTLSYCTHLFGATEVLRDHNFCIVNQEKDKVPAKIHLKITGTAADTIILYNVQAIYPTNSKSDYSKRAEVLAEKMEDIEKDSPDQARELIQKQVAMSSAQYRNIANQLR